MGALASLLSVVEWHPVAKACGCCRREYSRDVFLALPAPRGGAYMGEGAERIALRNCTCGSTLGLEDPEAPAPGEALPWELSYESAQCQICGGWRDAPDAPCVCDHLHDDSEGREFLSSRHDAWIAEAVAS